MANEQNLKKFGSEREPSEAGRKGGKASGVARRRKRDMKNAAKLAEADRGPEAPAPQRRQPDRGDR